MHAVQTPQAVVDAAYRHHSRPVLATLIRLLGDHDLAEDALLDAFTAAVEQWPRDGVPANPRSWLISTGKFKAIDSLRRQSRFQALLPDLVPQPATERNDCCIEDDRLRMIFTCCHPDIPQEGRVALTLREVCGLTTEQIAASFLISTSALAQRIVRARARIRESRIPYRQPGLEDLTDRLNAVLQVIYLVYNAGYNTEANEPASSGQRIDLSMEAIWLARLLMRQVPEPEVIGLLALLLLTESRRPARTSANGDIILLEEQDRSLWNLALITEGISLVERALSSQRFGPYAVQAAISAVHAEAQDAASTDWAQIVSLYDVLSAMNASPVIALNRAVAVAMHAGPSAGLPLVDELLSCAELQNYALAHAARADLCRRLNRNEEARQSYERALQLTPQVAERRFLTQRIESLKK